MIPLCWRRLDDRDTTPGWSLAGLWLGDFAAISFVRYIGVDPRYGGLTYPLATGFGVLILALSGNPL